MIKIKLIDFTTFEKVLNYPDLMKIQAITKDKSVIFETKVKYKSYEAGKLFYELKKSVLEKKGFIVTEGFIETGEKWEVKK